tara:strand:- start:3043 stop:3354 length:312 start_codon:yes stop_codon:yes gene_type:complete
MLLRYTIVPNNHTVNVFHTNSEFEKVLEKKFFCSARFAQEIEALVIENPEMNYIDAIVFFCGKNNIDLESVPKLISKPLKEKIKYDAMELNFLKKTSRAKLLF